MSDWTPVAKVRARLLRAEAEEPGSMQHFTAAHRLLRDLFADKTQSDAAEGLAHHLYF